MGDLDRRLAKLEAYHPAEPFVINVVPDRGEEAGA
jgi:hypothetical protein